MVYFPKALPSLSVDLKMFQGYGAFFCWTFSQDISVREDNSQGDSSGDNHLVVSLCNMLAEDYQ